MRKKPLIENSVSRPIEPTHTSRRFFLKAGLSTLAGLSLVGCTATQIRRSINTSHQLFKGNVSQALASQVPGLGIPEVDGLVRNQIASLLDELVQTWGEKRIASPKEYVKYTDHYQSRALIGFTTGRIQVETLINKNPKSALKKAIVSTLLTPNDPSQVDLLSAKPIQAGQTPFLVDLVRDHQNQAIRYAWRAKRFADYLIKKGYKTRREVLHGQSKVRHYVTFDMRKDYQGQQQHRYQMDVLRQAKRFAVEPALVYGIIETESAFNPFAISSAPAYGLMQIVPTTAGRDAYQLIHNRPGTPSKQTLFTPSHNIEYGVAYLSILSNRYLSGIHHSKSREYCVIAAYNTGAGNVLKAFSVNKEHAIRKINSMHPQYVYQYLTQHLAYAEARRYVVKVTENKRKYQEV